MKLLASFKTGPARPTDSGWWNSWWFWAALCLLSMLPLLYPAVPPLTDVPGHMGRYEVQLHLAQSPGLLRWYSFEWRLIPNLGVDLLVQLIGPWLGVELATKLVILMIPLLLTAGYVLVARQIHGYVPPTALFALPLVWCYPIHFGFINFGLSLALGTLAFALWIHLGERRVLRAAIFLPIACIVWVAHIYGWAVLCVLAVCHEFVRQKASGRSLFDALLWTGIACGTLVTPQIVKMLPIFPGAPTAPSDYFFDLRKLGYLMMVLRDRWLVWDVISILIVYGMIVWTFFSTRFEKHAGLALATAAFAVLFVLLPGMMFGSQYADMRLVPTLLASALLAVRPVGARLSRILAIAGLVFVLARDAGTAASFYLYDRSFSRELAALDHVPRDATMVSLVVEQRNNWQGRWAWPRTRHLPGLAIVRRHTFSNDQWETTGGQLLSVHFAAAKPYDADRPPPTSYLIGPYDADIDARLDEALKAVPPVFGYLWIITPPTLRSPPGWRMLWHDGTSALYRKETEPVIRRE